jgi:hypothetical protein
MFDSIVRTLCDVRPIPDLRKNLISLDTLDRNGLSFYLEGEVLKVSKGVMTVMKGQRLLGNIYVLLHTTVVGVVDLKSKSNNSLMAHVMTKPGFFK